MGAATRTVGAVGLAALLGTWAGADEPGGLDCGGGVHAQGGLVVCRAAPDTTLSVDGAPVARTDADGVAVIGVERDAGAELAITAGAQTVQLAIEERSFIESTVSGLDCSKVSVFTDEQLAEIRAASALKKEAFASFAEVGPGPLEGFVSPADGRRSSPYGARRTLTGVMENGETCSRVRTHWGLDIAEPEGTPILAPAAGVVSLAAPLYFEGETVFLDHGLGLVSVFMHMSAIDVEVGDTVTAGERIGAIGSTGRSTGPHLHWGVKWRNGLSEDRTADFYVDPALTLEITPLDAG